MITVGGHTFEETTIGNGVIIDVGCRGFAFADYFFTNKVYCIDPDETIFNREPMPNHTHLNLAISDTSGETTYYPNGEATMIRQFDPDPTFVHIDQKYSKTCKVITMDDLYKITGENVEILKLDCEGAEYAILGESFKPIPKQISVEFHNHCVPELHAQKYTAIIERLSEHYTMHNAVWEQRHGCGFNFWDTLFIRKT
jgi:FkbM family methyltransferase